MKGPDSRQQSQDSAGCICMSLVIVVFAVLRCVVHLWLFLFYCGCRAVLVACFDACMSLSSRHRKRKGGRDRYKVPPTLQGLRWIHLKSSLNLHLHSNIYSSPLLEYLLVTSTRIFTRSQRAFLNPQWPPTHYSTSTALLPIYIGSQSSSLCSYSYGYGPGPQRE